MKLTLDENIPHSAKTRLTGLPAELCQVSVPTVNEHIQNMLEESELDPAATIRKVRIVHSDLSAKTLTPKKGKSS